MDAYEAVLKRRSVRKYKPEPVARELLLKVLDAARLAPTARNEQPCEFVVVTQRQKLRELASVGENARLIGDAAACIVVLSRPCNYYLEDGSAATTQLMIAAAALGLGTCWVAGDKKPYAANVVELCGAPPEFKLVALIAIGYAADIPTPPKRALAEVVHWETFA